MEDGKPLIFLEPLTDSVKKLKEALEATAEQDGIEIYEVENPEEYNQLIPTIGQSLTIACSPKKTAQCIQPLRKFILKNNVKVLLINNKNIPPKTLEKFRKIGLTEYIQEPVPPKTLLYKVSLILRSLKKAEEEHDMEFKTGEERQVIENDYEDKKESSRFANGGKLEGKVHKQEHIKDNKDVFDDNMLFNDGGEATQEDPHKNTKEYNARQKQDSSTSGRLTGQISNQKKYGDENDDFDDDEDLFGSLDNIKKSQNKADKLGGHLQGSVSKAQEQEDNDDFDADDLFKSLDQNTKSSYKEEDKGGNLRGDLASIEKEESSKEEDVDDLFASLDKNSKSSYKEEDKGGKLKGNVETTKREELEEDDFDEDLFASLDNVKKSSYKDAPQAGVLKGDVSPTIDAVEDEKDKDEDLFASLDDIKKSSFQDKQSAPLKGDVTANDETSPTQKDREAQEDLLAGLDAVKKNKAPTGIDDIDPELLEDMDFLQEESQKSNLSGDHSNELIDNEKGLERKGNEKTDAKSRSDQDLFDSLAKHASEEAPRPANEELSLRRPEDEADTPDENRGTSDTITYEKKGDLGEQTIDYRNLDKQPVYEGGTKEKLEIKITDGQAAQVKKEQEGFEHQESSFEDDDLFDFDFDDDDDEYDAEEEARAQAEAQREAEEEAREEQELEEALNSIIIPDPKDMDFFIEATNKVILGDSIKQMTSDYINSFCSGTLVVYNLENECILGNEIVDERFEAIKNVLKIKRKPSWNDTSFRSELLYYHCPIIENGRYHNFIIFMTTPQDINRDKAIPARIELCMTALKGSYLNGDDRSTTKIETKKSAINNVKDSVSGLFKGFFGKKEKKA